MQLPDAARHKGARRIRIATTAMFLQSSRFVREERIDARIAFTPRAEKFR